jgi:hypothetical protein
MSTKPRNTSNTRKILIFSFRYLVYSAVIRAFLFWLREVRISAFFRPSGIRPSDFGMGLILAKNKRWRQLEIAATTQPPC